VGGNRGCVGLATCYEDCPATCAEICGDEVSCVPGCTITEQKACRVSTTVDEQIAFLELGACQLGNCAAVSDDEKNPCMWTHCATETAHCMASIAVGDQPCGETFKCMMADYHDFDGVTECITDATKTGAEDALELLACFALKRAEGAPCYEQVGFEEIKGCIVAECPDEVLACPFP
jgi:hypothetical protein